MKIRSLALGFGTLLALLTATNAATLTYTTGLDVWLDASDVDGSGNSTLTDGAAVATWTNKGTTGLNDSVAILSGGAGGTNGIFVADGGNGAQDAVQLSNTRYQFGQEFMDSPNVTMYFVVQHTGTSQGALFNDYGTGSELYLLNINLNGTPKTTRNFFRDVDNDTVINSTVPMPGNTWVTAFSSMDATTKTASYGLLGGTIGTNTNANYDSTVWNAASTGTVRKPTLFGFHDGNNTHDFNGYVSEVLIYDHILTSGEQAQVESYLVAKTVPEPSSVALLSLGGFALLRRSRK